MKKISKLINCIALLATPSVAFSVFTEKDLHLYVGQAYEQYRFNWESIAAIGSGLIHEVVDPNNEMLKQLQKVFISIRDQTFSQRTLSNHFFEDLKSKSKQDNILNFLERIIY